jgi:hypothetical protein
MLLPGRAIAGSGSASVGAVSASYSVPDIVRFDGPGCAMVPWTVSYQRPPGWDIYIEFDLRQSGSNSPYTDSASPYYSDPSTGTLTGSICVDDSWEPAAGPFTLTGTVEGEDDNYRSVGKVPLPASQVTLNRNTSKMRLKVKAGTTYSKPATIRGKVTATTVTRGRLGAEGSVVVEIRRKKKWRELTRTYPDAFGAFSTTTYQRVAKGAKVRAHLIDCGWCTNTKATTRAR